MTAEESILSGLVCPECGIAYLFLLPERDGYSNHVQTMVRCTRLDDKSYQCGTTLKEITNKSLFAILNHAQQEELMQEPFV